MFLNKANVPKKNDYLKMEISSDSSEMGKIIFTVTIYTQRFENIYITIKKQ